MYQRILIATDGSELSGEAVHDGLELAERLGAQVIVLNVVPRYPVSYFEGGGAVSNETVAEAERQWAEAGQAVVNVVKASGEARGIQVTAITRTSDDVAGTIISSATKHQCDLIVMASHGRKGMKRVLLGSETTQVLTHSHIPVLILRKKTAPA